MPTTMFTVRKASGAVQKTLTAMAAAKIRQSPPRFPRMKQTTPTPSRTFLAADLKKPVSPSCPLVAAVSVTL